MIKARYKNFDLIKKTGFWFIYEKNVCLGAFIGSLNECINECNILHKLDM